MESYVIRITANNNSSRDIRISADATLYRLHLAILNAFAFEDDREHCFFMDNKWRHSREEYVSHRYEPAERSTHNYTLRELQLRKGKKFLHLFDDFHTWNFQCQVLQSLDEKTDIPWLINYSGDAPSQYDYEEEWEDEEPVQREIQLPMLLTVTTSHAIPHRDEWPEYKYPGFPRLERRQKACDAFEKLRLPYEFQMEIEDYFLAASRLYGILPLRKLLEIYNCQNKPISEELFLKIAEIIRHDYHPYSILNGDALRNHAPMASMLDWEIVAEYIYENDIADYDDFAAHQEIVPIHYLPKKDFLLYSDIRRCPANGAVKAMREYLYANMESQQDAEFFLSEMHDLTMKYYDFDEIIDYGAELGLSLVTKKDEKVFRSLYLDFERNTRRSLYRGYTETELHSLIKKEDTPNVL